MIVLHETNGDTFFVDEFCPALILCGVSFQYGVGALNIFIAIYQTMEHFLL